MKDRLKNFIEENEIEYKVYEDEKGINVNVFVPFNLIEQLSIILGYRFIENKRLYVVLHFSTIEIEFLEILSHSKIEIGAIFTTYS
jgi:hypothetical protein